MEKEIKAFVVNTKAYDEGRRDCGEWVSFPVSPAEMKDVYDRIGIDGEVSKEVFLNDFQTDVAGLHKVLSVHTDIDELNYLAVCLSELPSSELAKLDAIEETAPFDQLRTFIDFSPNTPFYLLIEDVHDIKELGEYCLNQSGRVQMPEEWKGGIDTAAFGAYIQKDEAGIFTKAGYLAETGCDWLDDYCGKEEIHNAFRISPQAVLKSEDKAKQQRLSIREQLAEGKDTLPKQQKSLKKNDMER